jgi:hypothetical protein
MNDTPTPVAAPPGGDVGRDNSQDRKSGFTPMRQSPEDRAAPAKRTERTFETGKDAAEELTRRRRKQNHVAGPPREMAYRDADTGEKIPGNETVDLKRAVKDLAGTRFNDAVDFELANRNDIAKKVDKLRSDANVPTQIDPNAPPAPLDEIDARLFGNPQPTEPSQPQIDQRHLAPDLQPAPPGVDPDLHLAFQNPKVRAAVEKEVNTSHETARTAQAHYAENVVAAQEIALGSIYAAFPEMVGVKTQPQMQELLNRLQYTDPARFQQATKMLQSFTRLHGERQNMERQKQNFERQNFARDSAREDAAFNKAISHVPAQQREAVAREAIVYAQSLGVDERTLTHLFNTNPIMRTSAMRQMMFDAAAGSLARKQLAAQRQQNRAQVPPVSRPGSGGPRTTAQSANLQALSQKLNVTGGAREAADLLIAMRNSKRRG